MTIRLNGNKQRMLSMNHESLIENETWDLVQLPSGRTPIGSKWVLHKSDGTVERFKARLTAKGYVQQPDGYIPTKRFKMLRTNMGLTKVK